MLQSWLEFLLGYTLCPSCAPSLCDSAQKVVMQPVSVMLKLNASIGAKLNSVVYLCLPDFWDEPAPSRTHFRVWTKLVYSRAVIDAIRRPK